MLMLQGSEISRAPVPKIPPGNPSGAQENTRVLPPPVMSVIEMLQATPAFALPGVLRNAIKCMSALKSTLTACDAVGWNWN